LGAIRRPSCSRSHPTRDTENKKKLDTSHELQELREVREEVQRLFVGARSKNVVPYAEYIVDVIRAPTA